MNNGYILGEFPNTIENQFYPNHSTYGYPINISASDEIRYSGVLYDGDIDLRAPVVESGVVGTSQWETWIKSTPELSGDWDIYNTNKTNLLNGYYSVDSTIYNRGFLYYTTAENLPSFYSISFRSAKEVTELNTRFLYKMELESNGTSNLSPKIRSISFKINKVD